MQMLSRTAGLLRSCEAAPEALAPALQAVRAVGQAFSLPPALEQERYAEHISECINFRDFFYDCLLLWVHSSGSQS
jgi:hypothetical protein